MTKVVAHILSEPKAYQKGLNPIEVFKNLIETGETFAVNTFVDGTHVLVSPYNMDPYTQVIHFNSHGAAFLCLLANANGPIVIDNPTNCSGMPLNGLNNHPVIGNTPDKSCVLYGLIEIKDDVIPNSHSE